jgi:hypothetical protein
LIAEADAKPVTLIVPLRCEPAKAAGAKSTKRGGNNAPGCDVREALGEGSGADLTRIGGIDVSTALKRLAEPGAGLREVHERQALLLLAGAVPRHADLRPPTPAVTEPISCARENFRTTSARPDWGGDIATRLKTSAQLLMSPYR